MRRRPWVAALLSIVTPGLGHLYNGEPNKGALFYASALVVSVVSLVLLLRLPGAPLNVILPLALPVGWVLYIAIDAFRRARRVGTVFTPRGYNRWYVYMGVVVLAGFVQSSAIDLGKAHFVEAFRIPGAAMRPTLLPGDYVLVRKSSGRDRMPARGEAIVFAPPHAPEKHYVMRVVGLPGDTLRMHDKKLYVNGRAPDEPYVDHTDAAGVGDLFWPGMRWQLDHLAPDVDAVAYGPTRDSWGRLVVPERKYFVLGDNRDAAEDSRYWGFVSENDILGRPARVYFSRDPANRAVRWDRIGQDIS